MIKLQIRTLKIARLKEAICVPKVKVRSVSSQKKQSPFFCGGFLPKHQFSAIKRAWMQYAQWRMQTV
jgi:hypothetical protein